ncbi:MAG TPA: hypothetical protein RMH99_18270 [Sandaracinaceae bacterium LLY-WYZ-13_1]|nr:hypothetical protein [Sandaracinaceae bacterium LLY-WYZ-13_1]
MVPPDRTTKSTVPDAPDALARRAVVVVRFVDDHGLGAGDRRLLLGVLDGHRGRALADHLGWTEAELDRHLREFRERAKTSVYEAAVEVLSEVARSRREVADGGR